MILYVNFNVEFQINHIATAYCSNIKSAVIATIINAIRYIVSAVAGVIGGQGKKYIMGMI